MPGAGPRAVASGSHARSRSRRERRGSAFQLFVAIPGIRPTRREPAQYPSSASTAAAGSGGPNIAAPDDYATLLDREQAAFDAAEFTPATADKDAPPPDVGFGSTRNPQLRRRALVPVAGARRAVDRHRRPQSLLGARPRAFATLLSECLRGRALRDLPAARVRSLVAAGHGAQGRPTQSLG